MEGFIGGASTQGQSAGRKSSLTGQPSGTENGHRGVSEGLADVLARGSLAAAVSHAYLDRQVRLEAEALERDAGFGDTAPTVKRSGASTAPGMLSEEERLRDARKEAIRRYTEVSAWGAGGAVSVGV